MELLLAGDVAKRLGLSADMVRVLERRGKLRALRTPAGVRLFRARYRGAGRAAAARPRCP